MRGLSSGTTGCPSGSRPGHHIESIQCRRGPCWRHLREDLRGPACWPRPTVRIRPFMSGQRKAGAGPGCRRGASPKSPCPSCRRCRHRVSTSLPSWSYVKTPLLVAVQVSAVRHCGKKSPALVERTPDRSPTAIPNGLAGPRGRREGPKPRRCRRVPAAPDRPLPRPSAPRSRRPSES